MYGWTNTIPLGIIPHKFGNKRMDSIAGRKFGN